MRNNCDIVFRCCGSLDGIGECSFGNFTKEGTSGYKRCSFADKRQGNNYWECHNKDLILKTINDYLDKE